MLPFTREQFLEVFARYNEAVWPAQVVAYAIGLALVSLLLRPRSGGGRAVAALLALMWAWTGVAYHGLFFAAINKAAIAFAALFVVQGLLFAHAAGRGYLQFGGARGAAAWLGWALVLYAALVYPVIGMITGHAYPRMPMFGITPCPVVLFTLGVLLLAKAPLPALLLMVPLLWSLVGGSAAFLLGVPQDWPLLASSVVAVFLLARGRRSHRVAPVA